jgi:hypothetical protein
MEAKSSLTAFELCFKIQLAPVRVGRQGPHRDELPRGQAGQGHHRRFSGRHKGGRVALPFPQSSNRAFWCFREVRTISTRSTK